MTRPDLTNGPAQEPDPTDPWALLPSEVVCGVCHLARHKHLPECPVCKEINR